MRPLTPRERARFIVERIGPLRLTETQQVDAIELAIEEAVAESRAFIERVAEGLQPVVAYVEHVDPKT